MPIISVIVPVYKVEPYLRRCVDSILAQTFPDFELILVDDGSPDSCPALCDEFAKQDDRIVVIHKENGGVSSARNAGINASSAPYISFVDSDDYVSANYLNHLMSATDADYIVSGYWRQNVDLNWNEYKFELFQADMVEIRANAALINRVPMGMVWARRYKRSVIQSNKISFDQTVSRGEDVLFNAVYLSCCQSVCVIPQSNYYYCYSASSATTRFQPRLFDWSIKSVLQVGKIIGMDNEIFLTRVWNNALLVCDNYFVTAKGENLSVQLKMISCVFRVCANRYVRQSLKCGVNGAEKKKALMIRFYLYPFLPYIYRFYHKIKD